MVDQCNQVERNERKMDAKIDMLHQAGLLGTGKKATVVPESEIESFDEAEEVVCQPNSLVLTGFDYFS